MKKFSTVLLASALLLFGCGTTEDENNVVTSTDNTTTYTTEVIPTEIPIIEPQRNSATCTVISQTAPVSNFPDDIPLYPGALQFLSECKSGSDTYYALRYRTTDSPSNVAKVIVATIEQNGWIKIVENNRAEEYDSYEYYNLINAEKAGGANGRYLTYDIRNDLRKDGYTEIIIRENYSN